MFRRGKKKYEKWAKYLDLEDEAQDRYLQNSDEESKKVIIVMKNSETGEVRTYSILQNRWWTMAQNLTWIEN